VICDIVVFFMVHVFLSVLISLSKIMLFNEKVFFSKRKFGWGRFDTSFFIY